MMTEGAESPERRGIESESDAGNDPGGDRGSAGAVDAVEVEPIEISVLIDAKVATVYSLLADPAEFLAWMGGVDGQYDGTAGTDFEISFPTFHTRIAGEVVEVVENEKLTLTWGVEEGPQAATIPAGSTLLEITLAPEGSGTRATLRHSGLPTRKDRDEHAAGWRFHMGRLSLLANRSFLGARMDALVAGFFGAWNERDAEARGRLLAGVCEPDIEFADDWATLTGVDDLSLHIGNSQTYMPGLEIESDGAVSICLGEALIPWRARGADGEIAHRGVDLLGISGDGRIERVKGFWQ